jgi:methylmalonyl-CoA mutase N-terminal domain/subunit
LANGIEYVEAALRAGLDIDEFAPRLAFFFNCQSDFLEEIAKFRAARKLWAKIMRERFKAKDPKSMMLRFHTQTAGSSLTAQQPLNNVVRTTIEALAAVLGGTQSLHTNAFDEALCLPTEDSATLALRTQQIIAYESGVANSVDPFAGSYLIENWTERLVKEAEKVIEQVTTRGGMVAAIEQGFPQQEIEKSAYEFQMRIEKKQRIVVGVNMFQSAEQASPLLQKPNPAAEKHQCERLSKFKAARDVKKLAAALDRLGNSARGQSSVMEEIFSCVQSNATLGEISDVLRKEWGEHH